MRPIYLLTLLIILTGCKQASDSTAETRKISTEKEAPVENINEPAWTLKTSIDPITDKNTKEVYIDASGLPTPPEGMVYQVWALKLEPVLTPTSIGLLDSYATSTTKVIKVENANEAQAFGITLEPAGGSAGPTMEQLYTLGKV